MAKRPADQVSPFEKKLGGKARASSCREQIATTTPSQRQGDRASGEDDDEPSRRYVTAAQVRQRYSLSDVGLWRWLRDAKLGFPQPAMRVRDRRYWLENDLIAWERSMIPHGDHYQMESV
jgi:hypothetical protein